VLLGCIAYNQFSWIVHKDCSVPQTGCFSSGALGTPVKRYELGYPFSLEKLMRRTLIFFVLGVVTVMISGACSEKEHSLPNADGDEEYADSDHDSIPDGDLDKESGDDDEQELLAISCLNRGTAGATSACLAPTLSPEYYIEQSLKYFDTLDIEADPESVPNYSDLVARWEWPPWLLLTAYTKQTMMSTAVLLRQFDPSTVPVRDCRAFEVQPFGRCYISFEYEGGLCPIYEEFTFNDQGEMTFIEAWSDLPGMRPMSDSDRWAEGAFISRLSTRIPGLGNETGTIDLDSEWMKQAGQQDPDVAEFVRRAGDQWKYWWDELQAAENLYAIGCGW
jgi:hypothetical protein